MTGQAHETDAFGTETGKIVYVKPVAQEEAISLAQNEQLEGADLDRGLFAVHLGQSGERIAIVVGREEAFAAARAYDFKPRSVH